MSSEAAAAPAEGSIPSPSTSFGTYLPVITSALDRLTTSANALPGNRSDINFHRTMDRKFANDLDEASERVLKMAEKLLALVEIGQEAAKGKIQGNKGKEAKPAARTAAKTRRKLEDEDDVVDGYKRGVLGVVDGLLEDADSCLDDLSGQRKKAAIAIPADKLASAGEKLPGPFTEGKALGRLPSAMLHASGLSKPQLLFQDTIDNENNSTPWRPNLVTKQHAMVPLDFNVPLEYELTQEEKEDPSSSEARRAREARLALHPYYYETRHLPYPTSMFTISDPVEPRSFEDTPFTFVDTTEALDEMVAKLKQAKEIAVDLEHHSLRSYYGITCLIQISTRQEDFIVDTLALRAELREDKLGGVMADPSIVKVFHGSDSDMVWLQRDFDIYVVNLFDTFHATKVLGFNKFSLAYLLSHYCNFEADKRYQMADWRMRPLPEEMSHYARSDTHFLLYIYDRLRNALLEQSSRPPTPVDGQTEPETPLKRRNPQEAMREVLERSGETALKLYDRDVYDAESGKGAGGWASAARKHLAKDALEDVIGAVFRALHTWRDGVARQLDESPFYIMPNHLLKTLATRHFSQASQIQPLLQSRAPAIDTRAPEILALIQRARAEFRDAPRPTEGSSAPAADGKNSNHADSASPAVMSTMTTTTTTAPVSIGDVWDDLVARPAAKSSLFGSTIRSSRSNAQSSKARTSKGKTSGLFGKTIKKATPSGSSAGPSFDQVRDTVFADLAPIPVPISASSSSDMPPAPPADDTPGPSSNTAETTSEPFIGDTARSVPGETAQSPIAIDDGPSPPKRAKRDEIVQVKKRSKKPRPITDAPAPSNDDAPVVANGGGPSSNSTKLKDAKKVSKKRQAATDIPDFDYSKAPNLLDNPRSGIKDAGKKKKRKDKKDSKGDTGSEVISANFGPAPKEKSNMRSGNKSGTF